MAEFHIFTNPDKLSEAAACLFVDCAHRAIDLRGRFIVALSGGSTPRQLFQILAKKPYNKAEAWHKTVIFWGDERAVPPDHEWSNYKLAKDHLLNHVSLYAENIFRIKGELGAEQAAKEMHQNMISIFGNLGIPRFDLVLQGLGEDGHTASLFPGTKALKATDWVAPVIDPPANPRIDRVTLSFPVLNAARTALFLAAGKSKRLIISEIMNNPTAPEQYPAARITAEETIWYIDDAAFGQ